MRLNAGSCRSAPRADDPLSPMSHLITELIAQSSTSQEADLMNNPRHSHHRGFTLVELLIVIVIIGLLAAILIPTIRAALNTAKHARIALEISQLESGFEAYKTQNGGEYPPDFTNSAIVTSHLARAFPRVSLGNWYSRIRFEPFADQNNNGSFDSGEPYDDENDQFRSNNNSQ